MQLRVHLISPFATYPVQMFVPQALISKSGASSGTGEVTSDADVVSSDAGSAVAIAVRARITV